MIDRELQALYEERHRCSQMESQAQSLMDFVPENSLRWHFLNWLRKSIEKDRKGIQAEIDEYLEMR